MLWRRPSSRTHRINHSNPRNPLARVAKTDLQESKRVDSVAVSDILAANVL